MLNRLINFEEIQNKPDDKKIKRLDKVSSKDIAIIGIYSKLPMAENLDEFWDNLLNGKDCIRSFPSNRMEDYKAIVSDESVEGERRLCDAAYLDEIDKFDYELFNISPMEAKLMDPNQRLFLQAAWGVLEDAGYSGNRVKGSKTGIYVGHSSDFNLDYHMYIKMYCPKLYENISLAGNVKSVIASRIAYLLDLKGPSMLVDTACSSALVAVHLACQGIIKGDCDMAMAGGVKINLLPIEKGLDNDVGIRSASDRARTFDDSSDGIGSGEGVVTILLKELNRAVEDGDHIYGVVKGSAVNQDGNSIGLTAPNANAQEEVILKAWDDADIDPETISYIEAHGTATNLGDPIEVSGIERAFRKYTDKKGFCAIGSVKTNIGHLDNIAGLVGLIKLVLCLKYEKLPKLLHFKRPNRKIDFINSPVYINDKTKDWESNGTNLRGGVSSFGLSGTNCHVVLEQYKENKKDLNNGQCTPQIFTVSAKSKEQLVELLSNYKNYLDKANNDSLKDICYTANTGRVHHKNRIAFLVDSKNDLKDKIQESIVLLSNEVIQKEKYISDHKKKELSKLAAFNIEKYIDSFKGEKAILEKICDLYVKGAEVLWKLLYQDEFRKKVSLPTYPFKKSRCWAEIEYRQNNYNLAKENKIDHPLIERLIVKTLEEQIYAATFNPKDYWILGEHKVGDKYVLPGTAYLEMIREIYSKIIESEYMKFERIIFVSPFKLEENETREMHLIFREKEGYSEFTIVSQADGRWLTHVEGTVKPIHVEALLEYDIEEEVKYLKPETEERKIVVEIGPRWTDIKREIYRFDDDDEFIAHFKIPECYENDIDKYYLYPPSLDRSINAANTYLGNGTYLPLSYGSMNVFGPSPREFYSYIKIRSSETSVTETMNFDVLLFDKDGKCFLEVKDYLVKRVREDDFKGDGEKSLYHELKWEEKQLDRGSHLDLDKTTIIFSDKHGISNSIADKIKAQGGNVVEVKIGTNYKEIENDKYVIRNNEEDYGKFLREVKDRNVKSIIHMSTLKYKETIKDINDLDKKRSYGLDSIFYLTRAIVNNKFNNDIDLILISDYASKVTGFEKTINPLNEAYFGFGKVIKQEYSNLKCRCIDIDDEINIDNLMAEIIYGVKANKCAYRKGIRYEELFKDLKIDTIENSDIKIREKGVYIITGGMGALGLEISKYLSSKNNVNLILINRRKIPDKSKWDEIINEGKDEKLCRAIKTIVEIEKGGSTVIHYSGDTSNIFQMNTIIDDIKMKYGEVNGVIHCAGIAGDRFIFRKSFDEFEKVLLPKINGTWILDSVTAKEKLDFFVLFSSINAILGGQGQSDYTAANAYLNSFSEYRNKKNKRTLVINWGAWKEIGMAVDYSVDESNNTLKSIKTADAIKAFDGVLNKKIQSVIIGQLNYEMLVNNKDQLPITFEKKIEKVMHSLEVRMRKSKAEVSKKIDKDVHIKGSGEESVFTETEMNLAGIWGQVLGLEEVDIYDSFNNMGGDSILAIRLLKKLEEKYPGMVDISDVFAYSTVNIMAKHLDDLKNKNNNKNNNKHQLNNLQDLEEMNDLDDLLNKLAQGEMTINDADNYF